MKLNNNEYGGFFQVYINKVIHNELNLLENLQNSLEEFFLVLSNIPEEKYLYAYDDEKWTIKELVSHMVDTERILAYRALRISRNDKLNISGFNENDFVKKSNANETPFIDLLKEFSLVRKSNIAMFKSFNTDLLNRKGLASDIETSVRALGYILSGHVLHHLDIIKERYL